MFLLEGTTILRIQNSLYESKKRPFYPLPYFFIGWLCTRSNTCPGSKWQLSSLPTG